MKPRLIDTLLLVVTMLIAGAFARPPAGAPAQAPGGAGSVEDHRGSIDPDDADCEEEDQAADADRVERRSRTLARRPVRSEAMRRDTASLYEGGGRAMQINAELVERALDVARDLNPATARRLRELRERDPEAFRTSLATSGRRLLALAELKRRDRQLYRFKISELEYEHRVRMTARRLREAKAAVARGDGSPAQVEIIDAQLRSEIKMLVALSLPARAIYLKRLQEHLEKLKKEIDDAANDFEDTVEERYQQLMAVDDPTPS